RMDGDAIMREKMATFLLALGGVVLFGGAARPAEATPIDYDISFTASGFSPDTSGVSTVSGRFFIALDPDLQVIDHTSGIALDYVSQQLDSQLSYNYFPISTPVFPDLLQVGGITGGASGLAGTTGTGGGAAAGHAGTASCPAGTFICEDFEAYPTGAAPAGIWSKNTRGSGTIAVDATRAFSGANALHVTGTINADAAHITTPVSGTGNTTFVRFMMYTLGYPSSSGVHSHLARIGTTADSGPDSAYSLSSYNGTAIEKVDSIYLRDTTTHLNDANMKNRWVCLEYEIDKTGGVGKVVPHIWVDGKELTLAAAGSSTHAGTSTSWDPIAFEKFTIGLDGNQVDAVKGDFWIDDVIVAPSRVGCPK
ncbi:MAG: hypothetical protein ABUS79_15475, partial [Pseudomonadota bacterium]